MGMVGLRVIILIVDENRVLTFKLERQSPIPADTYSPVILELPRQQMKFPSWSVLVAWLACIVKGKQLQAQLAGVLRLNPRFRSGAEEPLHALMPEALDH